MEPLAKRQRIFAPAHHDHGRSFADQHEHYGATVSSESMDVEEDYGNTDEQEETSDAQLEQRRARLDYKLKSTFEAIFDKYGKDFDGVGDEIDLYTGEIIVNNGHLRKMQDERDAGVISKARRAFTESTTEADDLPTSSVDETDLMDEDDEDEEDADMNDDREDDDEPTSDDDVVGDTILLRGFAQANRFMQKSTEAESSSRPPPLEHHREDRRRLSMGGSVLPTRSDILLQFGPQLGPHIAEFVSQQQVPESPIPDDSHIESAWRVPRIPFPKPVKRPIKKVVKMAPEPERSPSPEDSNSIWAPQIPGRPPTQVAKAPSRYYESLMMDPLSDHMSLENDETPKRRPRKEFTRKEDQILLEFVEESRRQNLNLDISTWKRLELVHPHHAASSWKRRYDLKFTYSWPNDGDEPESIERPVHKTYQPTSIITQSSTRSLPTTRPPVHDRPSRIRKHAEKDPRIINWSQAVKAIESVDPDLHAGILEDTKRDENRRNARRSVSSSFAQDIDFVSRNSDSSPQQDHRFHSQHQSVPEASIRRSDKSSTNSFGVEIFSCAQCFETFNYQSDLDDHGHKTQHACYFCVFPECGFQSLRSGDVLRHQMIHQSTAIRYPCTHCQQYSGAKSFKEEGHLRQHILKSHPNVTLNTPCSHAECKGLVSNVYNLRRRDGDDLSEMCLHLFHRHQVTPYPCEESNCSRQGIDGFFTQIELVRHVSVSHPGAGALDRLRGPKLLDRHVELSNLPDNGIPDEQQQSHGDPDFPSSARNFLSRPVSNAAQSSSGFGDWTITPRTMTEINRGTETTPTTSISSMVVNPASGTTELHIRNSQSQERFHSARAEDYNERTAGRAQSNTSVNHNAAPVQILGTRQLSDPFRSDSLQQSLPTPQVSLVRSVGPSSALSRKPATITPEAQLGRSMTTRSGTRQPMPETIPDSQSFTESLSSDTFDTLNPPKDSVPAGIPNSLLRPIDSSYAFSDEEDEPSVSRPANVGGPVPGRRLTRPVVEIYVKSARELELADQASSAKSTEPIGVSRLRSSTTMSHIAKPNVIESSETQVVADEPATVEPVAVRSIAVTSGAIKPIAVMEATDSSVVKRRAVKASDVRPNIMQPNAIINEEKSVPPTLATPHYSSGAAAEFPNSSQADTSAPIRNSRLATQALEDPQQPDVVKLNVVQPNTTKPVLGHGNSSSTSKPVLAPSTPASRIPFQRRKSIALNADEDDFDELSNTQFDVLTHPRTNPQTKTNPILARVKQAANNKTPQVRSAPSHKRRLDAFMSPNVTAKPALVRPRLSARVAPQVKAGPSVGSNKKSATKVPSKAPLPVQDVLPSGPIVNAVSGISTKAVLPVQSVSTVALGTNIVSKPSSTTVPTAQEIPQIDPAIKTEDPSPTTLPVPNTAPTTKRSRRLRNIAPGPSPMKSPFDKQLTHSGRTGTPLLDLTPGRRQEKRGFEIRDSDGEEEGSSPLAELSKSLRTLRKAQTPVMDKAWDQAAIVLRTPGGTFRKCGEDGFRCRKGFCFACGIEGGFGKEKEKA